MVVEWQELSIEDVADVLGGGTPSTKDESNFNGDIPWITPKDLSSYTHRYIARGERNISDKGLRNSSARLLPKDTVLLTTRAPVGYVAIATNPVATNQGFRNLILHVGFQPEFFYYLLISNTDYLKAHASGTTFGELSGSTLKGLKFRIPPLPEQRAITCILGALDDKIELNRQLNQTLEAIAQALFKSWFVDFEPFRNQGMQDSPLGEIPVGWRVLKVGQVLELKYGKGLREGDRTGGNVPVYGSNGQVGWHNESLVRGPGIVVGRKGNPGTVTWAPIDFFPIDTTFYVEPTEPIRSMAYLFHALQLLDLPSLGADSAVPGLNRNIAYMSDILVPPVSTVSDFDKYTEPLMRKVYSNGKESQILVGIRDALLPKLLSGEIRVKGAEKFLEEAA